MEGVVEEVIEYYQLSIAVFILNKTYLLPHTSLKETLACSKNTPKSFFQINLLAYSLPSHYFHLGKSLPTKFLLPSSLSKSLIKLSAKKNPGLKYLMISQILLKSLSELAGRLTEIKDLNSIRLEN